MPNKISNPIQPCVLKKEIPVETEHWIKFKIQDENGNAVPNVEVLVTLPDHSIEEKTSDADGLIEICNISAGNCTLDIDWHGRTIDEIALFP